ncbi:MAG: type II toxin-antitoxin system VapC family toxin [Anaerolineales bacterium]|jgi:predicted nucleic acid-binding protein|nr:type II toxin-antitoxin system VapC family toxin [Anaerolineales bacterium]MDX9937984.1 type II toxin-antitoxin system VapC family toxin [Anaerolineales bacterium]WKZ55229.1 MAG: type II toxin-antitoxin system VapC family toxin [Anaerolineales bacterium]GER81357.1 PIN domain ribonuclease, VapC toxin family [Candidatus Denitrolinea symbiosum]
MNVIDSSGWLEYFINGSNADFFAPAIQSVEEVLVPTISLFEVFKRVLIEKNRDDALEAVAQMKDGRVMDLDDSLALVAAELSYELKLPLADSIILATARANNATLWTQDAHFKGVEGVRYIEKKD